MYTVAVQCEVICQHYLIGGDFGAENHPHSHPYRVEAPIMGRELDAHGFLAHERVAFWEKVATRIGHNVTRDGLHFLALAELEEALRAAGFANWEHKREAGRDSNLMLVAT